MERSYITVVEAVKYDNDDIIVLRYDILLGRIKIVFSCNTVDLLRCKY